MNALDRIRGVYVSASKAGLPLGEAVLRLGTEVMDDIRRRHLSGEASPSLDHALVRLMGIPTVVDEQADPWSIVLRWEISE